MMKTIKEVAKQLGCNANAIRFYEKKGLLTPVRGDNNYREYSEEDIEQLQFIMLYRQLGFSIDAIKQLCGNKEKTKLDIYSAQFEILNKQIHSMIKVRDALSCGIDELLEKNELTEESKSKLDEAVNYINETNQWKDQWEFDNWAASYDKDIRIEGQGLPFYKNYDEVIKVTANKVLDKGGTVVEVGIGTGNLAKLIYKGFKERKNLSKEKISEGTIIGVDQSLNMLQEAKKKLPKVSMRYGTFLKLPFEDGSCDTVVSSYAFHHNTHDEKRFAIQEMDRIIKQHGRIIITDLMFLNDAERKKYEQNCTERELSDLQDEYFGNIDEVEQMLKKVGYEVEHMQIDDLMWMIVGSK